VEPFQHVVESQSAARARQVVLFGAFLPLVCFLLLAKMCRQLPNTLLWGMALNLLGALT
jgi:hypothetical protein